MTQHGPLGPPGTGGILGSGGGGNAAPPEFDPIPRTSMPRAIEGRPDGKGLRVSIACARFNAAVCERLLAGAVSELERLGVRSEDITIARVPGAFELPLTALHLARGGADAVICLGAVVRGETPHFEYVAGATAGGIARVAEQTGVPILFGVLTTETWEQALERAGGRAGNKGTEAAAGAVEMANLVRALGRGRRP